MAKFLSRLFSGGSSFRGSHSSLSENANTTRSSNAPRTASSLENLSSYHIVPKELEKHKLHKAAWEGNLKKVQRLARPGQINVTDQHMRTPLHLAVVKGHYEIVKYLVDEDARLDISDDDRRTPLVKAVLSGNQNVKRNYQICQILMIGGAGRYINVADRHGRNALHYAIDFGNVELVELFLSSENCDPNYKDHDQMAPLHLAIKRKSPELVQILLLNEHGQQADPNIVNRLGQTPLHLAASVGYIDIVRILVTSNLNEPCDPDILDSNQLTAYDLAKRTHHEPCAKLIEEYREKWIKRSPRRLLSTSFNEQSSLQANSSISIHPAPNLQRENDETSDDSSSITTSKPTKSLPRQRVQRPSDQWSDDNGLSKNDSKPTAQGIMALLKSNPLQMDPKKTNASNSDNSTLVHLIQKNPLNNNSKKSVPTGQPTSIFGIQPAFDRKDSDNTSTSLSDHKMSKPVPPSSVQKTDIKKPSTYINTAFQPASNTKSWSDDTITAPVIPIKKSEPISDTWDTSTSEDSKIIPKPKPTSDILHKTLPFSPTKEVSTDSASDSDSVDTEIRTSTKHKPLNQTTIQNTKVGSGYKIIGATDAPTPVSEDSSWTTASQRMNKGIENLVVKPKSDESTWTDTQMMTSNNLKQSKHSDDLSNYDRSKVQPTGVENLFKIIDSITQMKKTQPTSSNIVGKIITTSMMDRTDSLVSENTLREADNDDDDYELLASWKKKTDEKSVASTKDQNSKILLQPTIPYSVNNMHNSVSSTKSYNDTRFNEIKQKIEGLERNQEDTRELKRQLKEMEQKKDDFEKLYKERDEKLRHVENRLEEEKNEKQRLELTTKNLNLELHIIKQKLQSLEDEKDLLNQRCVKLKEERDHHDEKLRLLQMNSSQTSRSFHQDDDIERIQTRHREELKLLSAENDDLHSRTKQLESDLELHKESLDVTIRYKIDLEKALEEKTFYQRELNRLKTEKDSIEEEKLEYKTKYNSLQEEIRVILFDRSKLEQKLTSELHEHIQEKQRSTDDKQKYRMEIEQLNIKLGDAEARLHALQTQNEALLASKDRHINDEFESLSQRLTQIESNRITAEQRYHNEITSKQKQTPTQANMSHTLTYSDNNLPSSNKPQQEYEYRLQLENDQERLYDNVSKSYQYLNNRFPVQQQQQATENYLIENSRKIRSDTERVKNELDRLRQDFDNLVSNYEPKSNYQQQLQLHSQIDIFRQFYENEYRQRQFLMSKPTLKPTLSQIYQKPPSNLHHNHSFNETCSTCTNSRLLRERLESAIDLSLADQRYQKVRQYQPIPRQASSLLTINTINNGAPSSLDLLRERYYV